MQLSPHNAVIKSELWGEIQFVIFFFFVGFRKTCLSKRGDIENIVEDLRKDIELEILKYLYFELIGASEK